MGDVLLQDLWFHQVEGVVIENVVPDGELVAVRARAAAERAVCPACGTRSSRVHSRYVRRLADSAVGGRPVLIELQVRRFRCGQRSCRQATLAEQVEGLTVRHGRRSTGLQRVLERVAVMLAGRPGARLSQALAAGVSRSRLLRLIRRLPEPETSTPRVLGVDGFALRKGHHYGTILIDIETHQPIDLLADRTTSTVARWLAEHPGVEVICRDRSTAYAEAGRLGAPKAIHVADRWRIWSNLAEAVEKTVLQHRALLREPHDPSTTKVAADMENTNLEPSPPTGPRTTGRLSDRVREQHTAIHALLDQGRGWTHARCCGHGVRRRCGSGDVRTNYRCRLCSRCCCRRYEHSRGSQRVRKSHEGIRRMISDDRRVFAILGAILVLVGAAVVVAKVIDADASNALRIVGFSLMAVGVLMFIVSWMRRATRRQE
ncbi:ISL3 family transposase [Streptomyces sp. NPDC051214]|uniref:ISL3 family transposase n=1 Tax=Streptomyces sp. NPDC051214 TaxID=3155282 RepID=UPI0034482779